MKKLELRNRIRTAFPHVRTRLHLVNGSHTPTAPRWRIRIEGANNSSEIHAINGWAHAANILPHAEMAA